MKATPSPILVCAGILMATAVLALADTVTLKSGEVIKGKVVSETDTEVVMDVMISAGITDSKTIAKADVQTVSKTSTDEIAYQAIRGTQPGPNSLQPAGYATSIKTLENFLTSFPQSAHAKDVQATLDAFKAEQARVKAGDDKWANRWYTAAEVEKNKYHLGAQRELSVMKEQASRRDFIGALNTFTGIEKSYPNSSAYPEAAELALNMVAMATADLDRLKSAVTAQDAAFQKGLGFVMEPEKSQMITARKAQKDAAEAAMAAAEKSGVTWKPFLPLASKSFDTLKSTISSEGPKISAIPVADMRKSVAAVNEAAEDMNARNFASADAKLKEAKALWAKNERITALTAEIAAAKAKPVAKGTTTTTTAPDGTVVTTVEGAATPKPTPTPKPKNWFGF